MSSVLQTCLTALSDADDKVGWDDFLLGVYSLAPPVFSAEEVLSRLAAADRVNAIWTCSSLLDDLPHERRSHWVDVYYSIWEGQRVDDPLSDILTARMLATYPDAHSAERILNIRRRSYLRDCIECYFVVCHKQKRKISREALLELGVEGYCPCLFYNDIDGLFLDQDAAMLYRQAAKDCEPRSPKAIGEVIRMNYSQIRLRP